MHRVENCDIRKEILGEVIERKLVAPAFAGERKNLFRVILARNGTTGLNNGNGLRLGMLSLGARDDRFPYRVAR